MSLKLSMLAIVISCLCLAQAQDEKIIKHCPDCHRVEHRELAKFCIQCGDKLHIVKAVAVHSCPKCKRLIDKGGRYCALCGHKGEIRYQPLLDKGFETPPPNKTPVTKDPFQPRPPIVDSAPVTKDFSKKLIYPGAREEIKHVIRGGKFDSAKGKVVIRKLYSCSARFQEVELHYRALYPNAGLFKLKLFKAFRLIKIDIKSPTQTIQVAFYSLASKSPQILKSEKRKVLSRLKQELKPIRSIDREMASLRKLVSDGRIARAQIVPRIEELKRQRTTYANSSSFWDFKALEQIFALNSNVLLITQTIVKK